jgi:hypothetical protein
MLRQFQIYLIGILILGSPISAHSTYEANNLPEFSLALLVYEDGSGALHVQFDKAVKERNMEIFLQTYRSGYTFDVSYWIAANEALCDLDAEITQLLMNDIESYRSSIVVRLRKKGTGVTVWAKETSI